MESIKVPFFSYGLLTIHICFYACSGWKLAGLQLIHFMTINCKNRKRNNLSENNWDANLPSITALLLYCRLTSNCWNIKTEIKKRVCSLHCVDSWCYTIFIFPWYPRSLSFSLFTFWSFWSSWPLFPWRAGWSNSSLSRVLHMLTWNRDTAVIAPINRTTFTCQMDLTSFCLYWLLLLFITFDWI